MNPGLRSIAKLALNSFYGKFGQRTNLRKTEYASNLESVYRILFDRTKDVYNMSLLSEDVMQFDYTPSQNFETQSANSNVPIAAFCSTYARLKLLQLMMSLPNRVLYHDTDSVIYTVKPGEFEPKLGDHLGDLTDELSCKQLKCSTSNCAGHFITEFVSCGPKNYSYKLNTGEVSCKVRGFSLNVHNSRLVNFDKMKEALFCWMRGIPVNKDDFITVKTEIVRDLKNVQIFSKRVSKQYGVVFDKRVALPNFYTVPYGF